MANELAKQSQDVFSLIAKQEPAFKAALGTQRMAEHFTRIALSLVKATPKLGQCDGMTLLASLMQSAQLKLYPGIGLGQSYIIPYYNSRTQSYDAQFQIGYQGYIDLFYRHQLAKELYVEEVRANDKFKLKLGTDRFIDHEPKTDGERGDIIGYYAIAKLLSGASNFCYMSIEDCNNWKLRYAKPDKNGKRGVWETDFDAMAKKTCIKQVLKYMPKSIEIMNIIDADESIKRPDDEAGLSRLDELPNRLHDDEIVVSEDGSVELPKKKQEKGNTGMSDQLVPLINRIKHSGLTGEEIEDLTNQATACKSQDDVNAVVAYLDKAGVQ